LIYFIRPSCDQGKQKVRYGKVGFPDKEITAKNIIIATGSVPFVPKGIEIDGSTYTSLDGVLAVLINSTVSYVDVKDDHFSYTFHYYLAVVAHVDEDFPLQSLILFQLSIIVVQVKNILFLICEMNANMLLQKR
jgi:hypothetical protein